MYLQLTLVVYLSFLSGAYGLYRYGDGVGCYGDGVGCYDDASACDLVPYFHFPCVWIHPRSGSQGHSLGDAESSQ